MAEAEATRYRRLQRWLGLARLAASAGYLALVLATGLAAAVAAGAARLTPARPWQVAAVAGALGAGDALLAAPLDWLRGYWLPRRYGLLHQRLAGWLADRGKAAAVGGALALAVVELVYALLAATPAWWLAAAGAVVALQVALAVVVPVWLLPLFYRLTPLADEDLRRRLLALARRAGVPAIDVWVADQSRRSRTANAALVGLGRTRRIVLFDTLVGAFTPAEVEAVLAHELAHHLHRDAWRGLAVQATVTVAAFWAADRLLGLGVGLLGLADLADPAGLPWLVLVLAGVGLAATPVVNALSRRFEREADDRAVALTGGAEALVAALERLAALNLAERRPPRLEELLLHSHPSIERRIARARRAAA